MPTVQKESIVLPGQKGGRGLLSRHNPGCVSETSFVRARSEGGDNGGWSRDVHLTGRRAAVSVRVQRDIAALPAPPPPAACRRIPPRDGHRFTRGTRSSACPPPPDPGHHRPGHHRPGHHRPGHHGATSWARTAPVTPQPRQPDNASETHDRRSCLILFVPLPAGQRHSRGSGAVQGNAVSRARWGLGARRSGPCVPATRTGSGVRTLAPGRLRPGGNGLCVQRLPDIALRTMSFVRSNSDTRGPATVLAVADSTPGCGCVGATASAARTMPSRGCSCAAVISRRR
jgi:hypothetical protein